MNTTISDRFELEPEGTIWDNFTSERYYRLEEIHEVIEGLNNTIVDLEIELDRTSTEYTTLINDIESGSNSPT